MTAERKIRLDLLLVQRSLAPTRERAQAYIMEGLVEVEGKILIKAGSQVSHTAALLVRPGRSSRYVSRGGLKIEKGLDYFQIQVEGLTAIDLGASTGGFTHCLLLRGARIVYAVDVGYGQLDVALRSDSRVVCLERLNARYLTKVHIPECADIVTGDLSFISLDKVFPVIGRFLKEGGIALMLVKPQFEAGKDKVRKGGIVFDPMIHCEVLAKVRDAGAQNGLVMTGLTFSPLRGPAGNIEFLACFHYPALQGTAISAENIALIVSEAHQSLLVPH